MKITERINQIINEVRQEREKRKKKLKDGNKKELADGSESKKQKKKPMPTIGSTVLR